eukprot:COSAG06_NODE_3577_length_5163_cov_2.736374_2_plen_38_part_00
METESVPSPRRPSARADPQGIVDERRIYIRRDETACS